MRRFLIRLAILNVFKQRLRAFLTIGGVALSTAIMVLLFGLGGGLQKMVTSQITKTSLQNVITVESKDVTAIKLNDSSIGRMQSISDVSSVQSIVNLSGQVTYNGISLIIPMYGVSSGYFNVSPVPVLKGSVSNQLSGNVENIVLSNAALKIFGLSSSDAIGKRIALTISITQDNASKQTDISRDVSSKAFVIQGVIDRGSTPEGYIAQDYLRKYGVDTYSAAKVQVTYPNKVSSIRQNIEQYGYQTTNIQDSISQVNRIFKVIRSILVAFGLITILVTVFGTVNTITIELVEATQQIGFLRIMGIKREEVGMLFMVQSIILATSGVIVGIIGGLFFGILTNGAIAAVASQGSAPGQNAIYAYQIPVLPIILMVMLAIALGWVIGLMPAKRAISLNPLAALKS